MASLSLRLPACVQSHLTLCDPVDCSLPGSSVHGILKAGILEWVAMPSSQGSSLPNISDGSCMGTWTFFFFTAKPPGNALLPSYKVKP